MKNKSICIISTLSFIICIFIASIDYWCFNTDFYKNEYKKLNNAEYIGMDQDDLDKTTDVMLGYLKGDYDSLDFECKVNGVTREVFNGREKAHMADVLTLYNNVISIRNICFIIYLITFVYILFSNSAKYIFSSFKISLSLIGFILFFILIFCLIDFDGFWTSFHHLFFPNNDLWLLDPRTDILIMMVPEQFFFDLCISILASIIVILLFLYFILKKLDRRSFND